MRLAKAYTNERLEDASQRALQLQACSYTSLRSILKRSLDRQTTLAAEEGKPGPQHENARGRFLLRSAHNSVAVNNLWKGHQYVESTHT
jgi:hypothetical protein